MRTGFNKNLANEAKVKLLTEKLNGSFTHKYDLRGNVIRDFKTELEIYANDEKETLIPSVDVSCFDACRNLQKHQKENEKSPPIIRKAPLAPLIEKEPKESAILNFIITFGDIVLKFKKRTATKRDILYGHIMKRVL